MKDIEQRVQRFNDALTSEGFSFDEDNLGAYLLDDEGERVCRLTSCFVESVAAVPKEALAEILKTVFLAHIGCNERSFKAGKRAGRSETVRTVHELLGIDRIVEALDKIDTSIVESRPA
jgi:pantothenate kinase type III